jgi:type VI protein secretion system component VasK
VLLAADYPFLNIFWTMIIFFAWVCWIMLVFRVFADIFRRRESSGWTKAAWCVIVIILPFLGVLIYLIANGRHMAERDVQQAQAAQAQFDERVRTVAASSGPAAEIDKAKRLLDNGTINETEYDALKTKALA